MCDYVIVSIASYKNDADTPKNVFYIVRPPGAFQLGYMINVAVLGCANSLKDALKIVSKYVKKNDFLAPMEPVYLFEDDVVQDITDRVPRVI